MAGSPDVNALGGRARAHADQPRRLTNRRAVARANEPTVEIPPCVELVAGILECQGVLSPLRWPVPAPKELGSARVGLPAEVEGGNSGKLKR